MTTYPIKNQFKNQLSLLETKLNEIKEVSLQLLKCSEMFSSPTTISTKPPPLIANTVVTALNKEREKRQLSLIVHNLSESTATEGETRKNTALNM